MSDTPRYDALRERAIADPGRHEALDVWEALKAAERENAALRKALTEIAKADRVVGSGFLARLAYAQVCTIAKNALEGPSQDTASELICDECHNADLTPEAREGGLCWRQGCKGRTHRKPHMECSSTNTPERG